MTVISISYTVEYFSDPEISQRRDYIDTQRALTFIYSDVSFNLKRI